MTKFCNRLKTLRKENNLTQSELGSKFHLNKSSISKYENGTQMPESDMLEKIADYFNVSIDYLLGRSEVKKDNPIVSNAFHSISTDGLDKKDIEMIKSMVERLRESHKVKN